MSDKWADQLISKVEFNEEETHIVKVMAHPDNGDKVGAGQEMYRSTVVSKLKDDITFATIYKNDKGQWLLGAQVEIITIGGEEFIKTKNDGIKVDNLDNLPRF